MWKACSGTLEQVRLCISSLWLLQQSNRYTNIQMYFLTVPEADSPAKVEGGLVLSVAPMKSLPYAFLWILTLC